MTARLSFIRELSRPGSVGADPFPLAKCRVWGLFVFTWPEGVAGKDHCDGG